MSKLVQVTFQSVLFTFLALRPNKGLVTKNLFFSRDGRSGGSRSIEKLSHDALKD